MRFIAVYVTPPSVFVAVLIGGGYGTGREIVEFFSQYGFYGGIAGLMAAFIALTVILGCTFDLSRRLQAYDYVSFFKWLIGPLWWLYEILYILLALLVLGVLSSAAGEMLQQEFGITPPNAYALTTLLLGVLIIFGREVLQRVFMLWSVGMFTAFAAYFLFVYQSIEETSLIFETHSVSAVAISGGLLYVMYNVAIAPVLLFATQSFVSAREAWCSAFLTAAAVLMPAILFHWSFSVVAIDVANEPVPVYSVIDQYAPATFKTLFVILLIGTVVQTGSGLIHGFIERCETSFGADVEYSMPWGARLAITLGGLLVSWLLARIGLISLIAAGYTAMGVCFAFVYIFPLLFRYGFQRDSIG